MALAASLPAERDRGRIPTRRIFHTSGIPGPMRQPAMHTAQRRVEFHNTDAAGLMHFSAYFTMMEEAEHELWRQAGTSVLIRDAEGKLSWPRVSATCDFLLPLAFQDEIEIDVAISRLGEKSITFEFVFRRGGAVAARGSITAVCCRFPPDGAPYATEIPADIRQKLQPHVTPA